jgi:uncharacterized protein with HEPN domain
MSKRSDRELLSDMLESIRRVKMYINQGDYQEFIKDIKTQDAVIRALEILGEASKGISPKVKEQFPDVPWKFMASMRNKLFHEYFGVSLDIVWEVATDSLPDVFLQIEYILNNEVGL